MTPEMVHYGKAQDIREQRKKVLLAAVERHPEGFVKKTPTPPALHTAVWINKPMDGTI